jgi:hypothetical protein
MITLKNYHREGHHLYRTKAIVSHINFNDYQRYFY